MKIIGRKREKDSLMQCLLSKRPEFVVVYGRRRVGKTYLIREYFNQQFSFYTTGLSDEKTKGQLRAFQASLNAYGYEEKSVPADWFEAFARLKELLQSDKVYREPINNKRVIFLDELPWMDTARSDFKSALDYFWNSWASAQEDLVLIACGSATSWIITNLLTNKKGFHNRITRRIHLVPFSLAECEELFELNDIVMSRSQMIESYMVFGGIPHYLNLFDSRLSLTQNVNELCFKEYEEIRRVYNTEILSWLRGTVDGNVMAGLEKALYLNDGKKLQEFLRKYMITCISCFDGASEGRTRSGGPWLCADRSGTETFYHGMMLGLAAGMSSRYYIRSNRESGEGRFDLVLEPKVHSLPGVIMEFKATKNDAGLSASAAEALKQIEDKHYDTDMKDRGIKEIVKYGIAFAGKNVEIAKG